jgi:hypothetical protein
MRQVEYVAAFVQADIDTTGFVEIPRGFAQPGRAQTQKVTVWFETKSKSLQQLVLETENTYLTILIHASSVLQDLNFVFSVSRTNC